ncbi:MAG: AMP-binding protein [Rhodococcus sp. (in: high G+C Gram-positive bacteria)]
MQIPFHVNDFLNRAVSVYGDRIGVVDEPDQPAPSLGDLTYRQLGMLARRQAARLDEYGIAAGERVAIVSQNSGRLLASFFGVSGWGRVLVPVNFRLSAAEVQYIVDHSGARVLFIDPELEEHLSSVVCEHKFVLGDDASLYASTEIEPSAWEHDESALAAINYTSGTTARPKGVQITHRNIWVNSMTFGLHIQAGDRDVYLHTLPMFHANGWGMPFLMSGVGARHIVLRKVDGAEILRRVRDHRVTVLCAAPAVVSSILDAALAWDGEVPGKARVRIMVAGAPPPTRTIARVEEELGWEFIQLYGLTETSPVLTVNRTREEWDDLDVEERAQRLGRAGPPALGVTLSIDRSTAGAGEVLARSNVVTQGYWQQPEETELALADGWFHTGDGGHLSDDGYLTIADRKKDVIVTGGENVSSIEVEDALFSHPAVAEVCVIGVPSEKWGETIKALVVLSPDVDVDGDIERELIRWCKARLAGYKAPTSVEFRTAFERTATGKLQKFKIRSQYWDSSGRQVN